VSRISVACLLLAAAVGVAGCTPTPGAAAVVGDRRIPVSDVQSATVDVLELVGPDVQVGQPQVLSWLVLAPFVLDEAARRGVGVSPDDARQQFSADPQRQVADPSDAAIRAVQSALVISRLRSQLQPEQAQQAADAVLQRVRAAGVQVSPRYGRFELSNFSVQAVRPEWLAGTGTSAATPQPAPQPPPTP
jgi:hypothetical protein